MRPMEQREGEMPPAERLRAAATRLREGEATMSPPVALALADWLDDVADHGPSPLMPTEAGAFTVADAVLGGEQS